MSRRIARASVESAEFGLCAKHGTQRSHRLIPIDAGVQEALLEMLDSTMARWEASNPASATYDPAEKYSTEERLTLPLSSNLVSKEIQELYKATNIPTDSAVLSDIKSIHYYFGVIRFVGSPGKRGTALAIRRSSSFKGLAAHRNALVQLIDDSLQIIPDTVFKFDSDFDFFVTGNRVVILRPKAFEMIACVDGVIAQKASENVDAISTSIPFVDLDGISDFAQTHTRAARLLASLAARDDLKKTSQKLLCKACKESGVNLHQKSGKLRPEEGHEYQFLMVLDRRRYVTTLVEGTQEIYNAASRQRAE